MAREREMLARITAAVRMDRRRAARAGVRLGIGDDAALIAPKRNREIVLSSDFFIEDSHFIASEHPAETVGYKSLARAVSDLAAMGAEPGFFLLNLAMPASKTGRWFDEFLRGMGTASRRFRILLIGGDLARAGRIAICVTVVGYAAARGAIQRNGARAGDFIFVSGELGAARLGLEIVRQKRQRDGGAKKLLRAHLYPKPRLELGKWLARNRIASAMMDISDGLSTDLGRLCDASGVGAVIDAKRLPSTRISREWVKRLRLAPSAATDFALHGGDDYELLFTVRPSRARRLLQAPGNARITCIGTITRERRLRIIGEDGKERTLAPLGWDHFSGGR
jgi:thiamine-monophosphate kinase